MGVLALNKKLGRERFVRACALAPEHERYSYNHIHNILERGLDKLPRPQEDIDPLPTHKDIQGQSY